MLIKLWLGGWNNQSKRMNMKLDEENCKSLGVMNGRYRKVWQFSRNEFWKNIGCLVSAPNFGLGGSRLLDKGEAMNISGNKRNRRSIWIKVDLNEVLYPILFIFLCFYFMTIPTPFFRICGISITRGKELRKYWTKGFKSEEEKDTY